MLTALFLLLGGILLGVSYALVRSNLTSGHGGVGAQPRASHQPGSSSNAGGAAQHARVVAQARRAQDAFVDDQLGRLTTEFLAITGGMAALSAVLGWFVAGRVLRPMSDITATAHQVSGESLDRRIALQGPDDELKQLADTFDSMLGRLESGFQRERAFAANASHELRSSLSVIRTETDVALANESDDPAALRRSLQVIREAQERSERLIAALLALARADRGDLRRARMDLSAVVRELTDQADLDGLRLEQALGPAPVLADPELLRAMCANLIDNAIRHNSGGGWIRIQTEAVDGAGRIVISNSGEAITRDEASSLTEPFHRLREPRTGEGAGLGLSIAASVVRAHGGGLSIEALKPGGLRVTVRLPSASADAPPIYRTGGFDAP
jgi:signal transduction histidine kinase